MALPQSEESILFAKLKQRGAQLITIESCTGGQIADRLTNLAGSSEFYFGGFVAYDNLAKVKFVQVNQESLLKEGAVSETVALELAQGALKLLAGEKKNAPLCLAIATSGIAGPGGGTASKPVGLCFVAVALSSGKKEVRKILAPPQNSRQENKHFFADAALRLATELC
jgi:PncC family amidohydrolase